MKMESLTVKDVHYLFKLKLHLVFTKEDVFV